MSKERLEKAKKAIKNNYPDERYSELKGALDYVISEAETVQQFAKKNIELNEFLNDYSEARHWGQNFIDIAMDIITKQDERVQELEQKIRVDSELFEKQVQQNKRYREAMINTIDELENIVHLNKSEDVLKHYAKNCIRFINEGLNID